MSSQSFENKYVESTLEEQDLAYKHDKPTLAKITDAPPYRKIPYVLTGYRMGYQFWHSVQSLFQLHNESGIRFRFN